MSKLAVIYHAHCLDGFGSAYIVWTIYGDTAEYFPMSYGDELPELRDRDVLFVDFSLKRGAMLQLAAVNKQITVLDHHKTAEEELTPLFDDDTIDGQFDMRKSGVGITWGWFNPHMDLPGVFANIQDRDLWQFKFDHTREICAAMYNVEQDFEVWDAYFESTDYDETLQEGYLLVRQHDKHVKELCDIAQDGYLLSGHNKVPIVNAPWMFASDLGNKLCEGRDFAVIWYQDKDKYKYSLRSKDSGVDVSEIAKQWGGGGHRNAAGFITDKMVHL